MENLYEENLIIAKVKNIVDKREIAQNVHFLLLPQCFQKSTAAEAPENVCMWKRVKSKRGQIIF